MNLTQDGTYVSTECATNWAISSEPQVLNKIHLPEINIAIQERKLDGLKHDINQLLAENIQIKISGDAQRIADEMSKQIDANRYNDIIQDVLRLVHRFQAVTRVGKFRLLLAVVSTNMCRKFHVDINDLRLLCTYSGPGTLWLTDDNINPKATNSADFNKNIVLDESKIRQAGAGDVVILKGAIYPGEHSNAIVHRSPTIEESGQKRLLLRIDTNESLNLWS